ncbi:MAG: hypothetical protein HZR80_06910 [Candidatus Heimdallarchaeota archaeon]
MTLTVNDLGIALAIAIGFVAVLFFITLLLSSLNKIFKRKKQEKIDVIESSKKIVKSVETSGEQLESLYLYSVYTIIIGILLIFLMFSFFAFKDNFSLGDAWPFIFVVVILIFCTVIIIDRVKLRSKRTVQRDMRNF